MVKDFGQASALIKRLMEDVGGSADAYEEPLSSPGRVEEEPVGPAILEDETPEELVDPASVEDFPEEDDCGVCVDGTIDWEEIGDRVWTNPPPVSDEYQSAGVVEDSAELLSIYKGFERARFSGEPQMVSIETGTYQIERAHQDSDWQLVDTVKDRFYIAEWPPTYNDVVAEGDLFIWVMPESDHDVDLGYIHMGYVFMHKS